MVKKVMLQNQLVHMIHLETEDMQEVPSAELLLLQGDVQAVAKQRGPEGQ
jgi:hypothetical protein